MSENLDEKRLKLAAQGLRRTAISLQAAVVSLLRAAEALTAEPGDNLVDSNPLDVNLQDLLKGDINGVLGKFLYDALNNEGETLDERTLQNGKQSSNGVKKPTRKPKPPRDPNAPIRPQNAFILYQKDISSQVKEENKGKPWSEIVHLISARWKALPKEDREIYERRFEDAKKRFEVDYKAYLESKDQEAAADADGHEENNNTSATPQSMSSQSSSEDENEDEENTSNAATHTRSSRSKVKSNASIKNVPDQESSKKSSKRRKFHEDDGNESAREEEEYEKSSKKSKKKALNEEGDEVQGKERKKLKKSSREGEKKKAKKSKKQD